MKGTITSALDRTIAFGLEGWSSAPEPLRANIDEHTGEFCAARWADGRLSIDRDVFGNARLLVTSGAGYSVVSDSLVVAAAVRRALGGSLTANTPSLLARATRHSSANQQLSESTMFEEIEFVPPGFGVTVDDRAVLTRTGRPLAERYRGATLDYRDSVRGVADTIAGMVAGYASVTGWTTALSLSGGYDSRAVYAAARAIDLPGSIRFESVNTAAVHAADHRAALGLTASLGMGPVAGTGPVPEEPEEPLTLWAATLLDVYDGFGPAATWRTRPRHFRMTGIGAALLKGGWGWRSWSEMVATFEPSPVRDAYAAEGARGLAAVGLHPGLPASAEHHYASYRNALHAGAGHLGVHMTGAHPLQQMQSAMLGLSDGTDPALRTPGIVLDLITLLDPESAVHPYDDPKRSVSRAQVESRLARLGGTLERRSIEPFAVLGDPGRVADGPSRLAISAARMIGATGSISRDRIIELARTGAAVLPPALTSVYSDLIENALWKIDKVDGDVRAAGASSARVAALAALAFL